MNTLTQPPLTTYEANYERRKKRFEAFHKNNPHIYQLIVDRCRELIAGGVHQYSIECIINRIRWDYDIGVHTDKSGFNFNNNYKSFYARKIMWDHPDLDGFFEIRNSTFSLEKEKVDPKETDECVPHSQD
jgi:hypothetical protein